MAQAESHLFHRGIVTHIVDPSDFWMRVGSEESFKHFEEFEKRLNLHCRQHRVGTTGSVQNYSVVLVNCTNKDGRVGTHWRRATVHRINRKRETYDVFYLDYGNTENVPAKRICEIVTDYIKQYPQECYKCALSGIQPLAGSWTTRGIKLFTKLSSGSLLLVLFLSFDNPTMCFRVALYQSDGAQRSLAHVLLDELTGQKTDEGVKEFAQDVTPEEYAHLNDYSKTDYDQSECNGPVDPSTPQAQSFSQVERRQDGHRKDVERGSCDVRAVLNGGVGNLKRERNVRASNNPEHLPESASLEQVVVVPTFDISRLQQCRTVSVAELQKESEAASQAERKARLQQDIIECHRDVELLPGMRSNLDAAEWGLRSQMMRTVSGGSDGDVYDRISAQIRSVKEDEDHEHKCDAPSTDANVEPAAMHHISQVEATTNSATIKSGSPHSEITGSDSEKSVDGHSDNSQKLKLPTTMSSTEKQPVTEEEEYSMQKKFRSILHELKQGEDQEIVRANFCSVLPVDWDGDEGLMDMLVQLLLEEGVRCSDLLEPAVSILDIYASAVNGTGFLVALRHCCEQFVKLPVGKMPSLHVSFANMMVKLLQIAAVWPTELQNVVKDFSMQCLERWIIFNKKGTQTGAIHHRLEAMYVDCVEVVLPQCVDILQEADEERVHFIYSEMKGKILESEVDYTIRWRLLDLLQCFQFSTSENDCQKVAARKAPHPEGVDQSTQTDTKQAPETEIVAAPKPAVSGKNKAIQTEKNRNKSSDSRKRTVRHADSSVQTDPEAVNGKYHERGQDAEVQTDEWGCVALNGSSVVSSCREQTQDTDEARNLSGNPPNLAGITPGRARRRRVLEQHLQGQGEKDGPEFLSHSLSSSPTSSMYSNGSSSCAAGEGLRPRVSSSSVFCPVYSFETIASGEIPVSADNGEGQTSQKGDCECDSSALPVGRAASQRVCESPVLPISLSLNSVTTDVLSCSEDSVQSKTAEVSEQEEKKCAEIEKYATFSDSSINSGESVALPERLCCSSTTREKLQHMLDNETKGHKLPGVVAADKTDHSPACDSTKGDGYPLDGSGDNTVPDDWEMRLSPSIELVGPAGDAPVSAGDQSTDRSFADCQHDPDTKLEDAEAWRMEDPIDPSHFFQESYQPDFTPACFHQNTMYGLENDSDDSLDPFYEAEYSPDETDMKLFVKSDSVSVVPLSDSYGCLEVADTEKRSTWAQDRSPEQSRQTRVPDKIETHRDNKLGLEENFPASSADLGCLPGEMILTMPRQTVHTKTAPRKTDDPMPTEKAGTPPASLSPKQETSASVVGYERGDLAGREEEKVSAKSKNPKGKHKFRPFSTPPLPLTPSAPQVETVSKPWVPIAKCTKCGGQGHMRYDCQNKGSSFFYD